MSTYTTNLAFSAQDQSLWGPDTGFAVARTLDELLWRADPEALSGEINLLEGGVLVPKVDLAYSVDVDNIEFGALLDFGLSNGVFNLSYPVSAQIVLPDQVMPGDAFHVVTQVASVNNPTLTVDGPSLDMSFSLKAQGEVSGYVELQADDEQLYRLEQTSAQLGGEVTIFDINNGDFLSGDLFAEYTKNYTWTDDILGGRKVFRTPYVSIGYDIDLNGLDGSAVSIGTVTATLPDLSVHLAQDDPLAWLSLDLDDTLGGILECFPTTAAAGEVLRRLDFVYRNGAIGTDIEVGLLSADLTTGIKPYIDVNLDIQGVAVELTTSDGQSCSGQLGDSFTFTMPAGQSGPMTLDVAYQLVGEVTIDVGVTFEGGVNVKLLELSGQLFWDKFDSDIFGVAFNWPSDADGSLKDWWNGELSLTPWTDTFGTGSGSYSVSVGTSTVDAQPSAALPSLRVQVLGGADINEGQSGTQTVTLQILRDGDPTVAIDASYRYAFGAGVTAADFGGALPSQGTLHFKVNETVKPVALTISGDTTNEVNEYFRFVLSSSQASVKTPTTEIRILDDDQHIIEASGLSLGTPGNDTIKGSSTGDEIWAGGGTDHITIFGGDDYVDGGAGNDTLNIRTSSESSYSARYVINPGPGQIHLTDTSSFHAIRDALAVASLFERDNIESEVIYQNVEHVNVLGDAGSDLLIYQDGTEYHGGTGTDTFYANWSMMPVAIVWNNDPTQTQTVNGVSVNGLERLLLSTGGGDDVIKNTSVATADYLSTGDGNDTVNGGDGSDEFYTGAGNDVIILSLGWDYVDGGAGVDKLRGNLNLAASTWGNILYQFNEIDVGYHSSYQEVLDALDEAANRFVIEFGSLGSTTATNVEQFQISLTGTSNADLLIYQNGTQYHGGEGTDTFFANWSTATVAIVWDNDPLKTATVKGVGVNSLERLLLATGAGADVIKNSRVSSDDYLATGAGNDTVFGGAGSDVILGGAGNDVIDAGAGSDQIDAGAGNDRITLSLGGDVVEGGAGVDTLIADQDLSGSSSAELRYTINNQGDLHYGSSFISIRDGLVEASNRYEIQLGSLGSTTATNVEQFQISLTGTPNSDLLLYQNGTRYQGGNGTDTFFADWSAATVAIVWDNDPAQTQTVNGVSVNGLERLLLATGGGNDVIKNGKVGTNDVLLTGAGNDVIDAGAGSDQIDAGAGDDSITLSLGGDVVEGGAGVDTLIADQDLSGSSSAELRYTINNQGDLHYGSSFISIRDGLVEASNRYEIQLGSLGSTTATNVEQFQISLTGTPNSDLLLYQNGTRYHGGNGTDTFFADWSAATVAIVWDNDPAQTQTVNGVSVNGLERLLLATGSGKDIIKNTRVATDDYLATGGGNDTVFGGAGSDIISSGAGNDLIDAGEGSDSVNAGTGNDSITLSLGGDVVEGGAGVDTLIADQDLSGSSSSSLRYYLNNQGYFDANSSFVSIRDGLVEASNRYEIQLGSLGSTTATNVEQFQLSLTATPNSDLLIYQNGTRYHGGNGTDTFFADWSAATVAIVWDNDPAQTQTVNGVSVNSLERLLLATGSGNDVIKNGKVGTDDVLLTGAGNDVIDAGAGGDQIDAGAGDDSITLSLGGDVVEGGAGVDTLIADQDLSGSSSSSLRYYLNNQGYFDANSSFVSIRDGLVEASNRYEIQLGSLGSTTATNVEQFQISLTGTPNSDLLLYQNGTRYHGGNGTDTFFADWSAATVAIVWDNDPAQTQTVNGVSVNGLERLLLATGGGNDVIKNGKVGTDDVLLTGAGNDVIDAGAGGDQIDAGAGDDSITLSLGGDVVEGGAGVDTLIADQDLSGSSSSSLRYYLNNQGYFDANSSFVSIRDGLVEASNRYEIQLGSLGSTTATNVEQFQISLTGTPNSDLLLYQNGTRYHGGNGTDTFFADWSAATVAIVWDNDPAQTQTVNGVSVNGLERLLLATGSGKDIIKNTRVATDDYLATGGGNDTVFGGAGSDIISSGAGNDLIDAGEGSDSVNAGTGNDSITLSLGGDVVEGGAGVDTLIADQDLSGSSSSSLRYYLNNQGYFDANSSFVSIRDGLVEASNRYEIQLGSLGSTTATNVEQFQLSLTATPNSDLLIYQNGTRYHGGNGTDTFFADWSAATVAIVWDNDPAQTQTVNGVSVNSLERLLLATGSGNDVIKNGKVGTDDVLLTGAGNDVIDAGAGGDQIDAGAGDDSITLSLGGDVVEGGAGVDTLIADQDLSGSSSSSLRYYLNNQGYFDANSSFVSIRDGLVEASNRYEIQLGSLGSTTATNVEQFQISLTGTPNSDLLLYQNGTRYHGGNGTDTFFADWSAATVAIVWDNDPAQMQTVNGVSVNGLERLLLATGGGKDVIKNTRVATDDYIATGGGNDTVRAGAGSDVMLGGAGNDIIDAGDGGDSVHAGAGNDTVIGGGGSDSLTSGAGADVFKFATAGDGVDSLRDFLSGTDVIHVTSLNFGSLPLGALDDSRLVPAGTSLVSADPVFVYNSSTGALSFDSNGNLAGGLIQFATLTGPKTLVASDIQVVAA